jgi:hypothetical protein
VENGIGKHYGLVYIGDYKHTLETDGTVVWVLSHIQQSKINLDNTMLYQVW